MKKSVFVHQRTDTLFTIIYQTSSSKIVVINWLIPEFKTTTARPAAVDSSEIPLLARTVTSGLWWTGPKKKHERAPKFKNNNMLDYVGWNDWDHGMIMWYNLVYVYMRIILLTASPQFFGMHSRPWHSSSAWLHTRTANVAELVPSWDAPRCWAPTKSLKGPGNEKEDGQKRIKQEPATCDDMQKDDIRNWPTCKRLSTQQPYGLILPIAWPEVKVAPLKRNQAARVTWVWIRWTGGLVAKPTWGPAVISIAPAASAFMRNVSAQPQRIPSGNLT